MKPISMNLLHVAAISEYPKLVQVHLKLSKLIKYLKLFLYIMIHLTSPSCRVIIFIVKSCSGDSFKPDSSRHLDTCPRKLAMTLNTTC